MLMKMFVVKKLRRNRVVRWIKKLIRLRRGLRNRRKYIEAGVNRLVVHRTSQHIYAQLIAPEGKVLAAALL